MRFEVWYKDYLKEKVANKGYDVVAVNDNAFKVNTLMDKSDKTVLMLVQGGNVTKSNIPNYDLNTMPVIVNFLVPLNLKNDFMSGLCDIAESYNGFLDGTDKLNGRKTRFKGIYNTPYVLGETTEIRHGGGTMKVCAIQWIISLNYGKDAYIQTPSLYLTLNGTRYPVQRIMRFEFSYNPAYDNYQPFGSTIQQSEKLSEIRSFVIQVAQNDILADLHPDDALQDLLHDIAIGEVNVDGDIVLEWWSKSITVKRFSLSGGIENNSGSYLITLEV